MAEQDIDAALRDIVAGYELTGHYGDMDGPLAAALLRARAALGKEPSLRELIRAYSNAQSEAAQFSLNIGDKFEKAKDATGKVLRERLAALDAALDDKPLAEALYG